MMQRLHRLLLRAYPARIRRDHGAEMARLVLDRAREARRNGAHACWQLTTDLLRDLAATWRIELSAVGRTSRRDGRSTRSRENPLRHVAQDVRYGFRLLVRRPGFTVASLAMLAVGIGASTAIYTLADRTVLHPLPVQGIDRLVSWSWASSYADLEEYRADARTFSSVFAEAGIDAVSVAVGARADLVSADLVSGDYFSGLGVRPAAGRLLGPADEVAGGPLVVVLSDRYWRRRFGGDPSAIGSTIRANGRPATIVGVAARGFRGLSLRSSPALWAPLRPGQALAASGFLAHPEIWTDRRVSWLKVYGRLAPGTTRARATSAVNALYRQHHPPRAGERAEPLVLYPIQARALGVDSAAALTRFVLLLGGCVALALFIACANVANMLLARATERRREVGVRLALGASRGRLVRQFMAESLLLGGGGGLLGLAVAQGLLALLSAYQLPGRVPIADMQLSANGATLAFGVGLSLATSLTFGLLPALAASATRPTDAMRSSERAVMRTGRVRAILVTSQVALCLVLLAGVGLFARALERALSIDLGFETDPVAVATVNAGLAHLTPDQMQSDFARVVQRLEAVPGVESAAWARAIPMRGTLMSDVQVEGYAPAEGERMDVLQNHVWPGYFETLGIRLVRGRSFTRADGPGAAGVAVVNEAFVQRYLPAVEPIGRRITTDWNGPFSAVIVGVSANSHWHDLRETPAPFVYLSLAQMVARIGAGRTWLVARAPGRAAQVAGRLAAEVGSVDRRLVVYRSGAYADVLSELLMPQRMGLTLLGFFGATALLLAALGIQGVASYVVVQRRREIGIRLALGAEPRRVRALVLRQALVPIAVGLALGLLLAMLVSPLAERFLYGLDPTDPLTLVTVGILLAALATLAGDIPARRAMRVDPAATLREP